MISHDAAVATGSTAGLKVHQTGKPLETLIEIAERTSAEAEAALAGLHITVERAFPVPAEGGQEEKTAVEEDEGGALIRRVKVHFQRHAEGYHNAAGRRSYDEYLSPEWFDALLNDVGHEQCREVAETVAQEGWGTQPQIMLCSPLRRTIQTGMLSFPDLQDKMLALECLREVEVTMHCCKRFSIREQSESFPHVDFSLVECDEDPFYDLPAVAATHHEAEMVERADNPEARGRQFLAWLKDREETELVVVSHGTMLFTLFATGFDECRDQSLRHYFDNAEVKTVTITYRRKEDTSR